MSRATLLAAVSTRIELVSGCFEAKATFTATEIPEHGTNGWFILWPDSEDTGPENGALALDRIALRCELLWRINPTTPIASIAAAMDKALAIRSKLRDKTLVSVDNGAAPSMDVGVITYERAPSGAHVVVSIPFVVDVFTSV